MGVHLRWRSDGIRNFKKRNRKGRAPSFDRKAYRKVRSSEAQFLGWLKGRFRRRMVRLERLLSTLPGPCLSRLPRHRLEGFEMSSRRNLIIFVLSALAIFLTYSPWISNKPVAEDFGSIIVYYLELKPDRNFRPVQGLIWLLLQTVVGHISVNPIPYHLISILTHILNCYLAHLLIFFITKSKKLGWLGAFLFAFYPRHHETIFWGAAYSHMIMTTFSLITIIFYIKFKHTGNTKFIILSLLSFLSALLSHEASAALILILFFVNRTVKQDTKTTNIINEISGFIPYLILLIIYFVATVLPNNRFVGLIAQNQPDKFYGLSLNISKIKDLMGYISYLTIYFINLRSPSFELKIIMALSSLAILAIIELATSRIGRFGIIWAIVSFLPYSFLVHTGNADRYFYLPSLGYVIAIIDLIKIFLFKKISFCFRITFILGIIIYILSSFVILQFRGKEWRYAGEIADQILQIIYKNHPYINEETQFYLINLPKNYGQARVLGVGAGWALRTHYNLPSLKVYGSYHPELISEILRCLENNNNRSKPAQIFVYIYLKDTIVNVSWCYNNPKIKNMLEEYSIFP